MPPARELGALGDGILHERVHAVALHLVDERAEVHLTGRRVADVHGVRLRRELLDVLVEERLVHDVTPTVMQIWP